MLTSSYSILVTGQLCLWSCSKVCSAFWDSGWRGNLCLGHTILTAEEGREQVKPFNASWSFFLELTVTSTPISLAKWVTWSRTMSMGGDTTLTPGESIEGHEQWEGIVNSLTEKRRWIFGNGTVYIGHKEMDEVQTVFSKNSQLREEDGPDNDYSEI